MWIKKTYTTGHLFPHLSMHYFGSCPEIRSSSRFLREIWISYFARWILEGIFVGGIVNIRNEYLFSRFMGNESQCGTNKSHENRFAVHAICLFRTAIHFPWTEKKRHSFLNCKDICQQANLVGRKYTEQKKKGILNLVLNYAFFI